jgi:RNA polymerase sigma factor (sigma-70 family)
VWVKQLDFSISNNHARPFGRIRDMANAPVTSITLLKGLASGTDNARWAEFFRIYEQPMRSFLAARFPSVDADDAIQETMVALMRRMPDYHYTPDSNGHFHNYLTGILKHKAKDALRREARESGKRDKLKERGAADAPREDPDDWKLAAMNAALEQLLSDESVNARAREVFRHVALMHEPPAEVATAFGISRTNVDQIKRRMVQRLSALVSSMTAEE